MARLKSPHALNALALFVVGGGMGVAMAVHIQTKYDLYSSSATMTVIASMTAAVMVVVLALLDRRWYVPAWIVTLAAPPLLFLAALRLLERHPPVPPLG